MTFFLWGRGVIIFDAAKFERRSFRRSGDTARAKLRIYYASNMLAAKTRFFPKLFFLFLVVFMYLGHVSGRKVVPDCRRLGSPIVLSRRARARWAGRSFSDE